MCVCLNTAWRHWFHSSTSRHQHILLFLHPACTSRSSFHYRLVRLFNASSLHIKWKKESFLLLVHWFEMSNIRRLNSFCILHTICLLTKATVENSYTASLSSSLSLFRSLSLSLLFKEEGGQADSGHWHLSSPPSLFMQKQRRGWVPRARTVNIAPFLSLPPTQ